MNKVFHPIKINFTHKEYMLVDEYAKLCGLSKVELCRMLLKNYHPKPMPDRALRELLDELYDLHNILQDELAAKKKLQEIILTLERKTLLPEQGGNSYGHDEPLGD